MHVTRLRRARGPVGRGGARDLRARAAGRRRSPKRDRAILRLCDALHDRADVDDALWAELAAEFAPAQLVELIVLAGFYHTVSFATNALRIELEPGAARFPA